MTDREQLIELIQKAHDGRVKISSHNLADYLLANGVRVQKQGEWQDNHNGIFTCSVCGGKASKMNYCGNCGAKLKKLGK